MRSRRNSNGMMFLAVALAITLGFAASSRLGNREADGAAKLVSIEQLPEIGDFCPPEPAAALASHIDSAEENNLFTTLVDERVYAAQNTDETLDVARPPVRNIMDTDPIYSAVTVDTRLNEVYLQDPNTWTIRVFNRLDNTPDSAPRTEAKRVIGGPKTDVQFNSCIYVDPKNGDIYSVENDIGENNPIYSVDVFAKNANGNVDRPRKLHVTHRAYAMAVDEDKEELYLSVQYPPQVAVYRKQAAGEEKPTRLIQGETTRLADSHG